MTKPPSRLVQETLFPAPPIPVPDLRDYDQIIVNSSGSTDSMATLAETVRQARNAGVLDPVTTVFCDHGEKDEWPGTKELAAGPSVFCGLGLPSISEEQRRTVARAAYGRCVCGGVACGKSHRNWRDMGRCGSTENDARLFAVPVGLVGITGEPGELVAFCGECLARVQKRHAADQPAPGTQRELALFDGDGTGA